MKAYKSYMNKLTLNPELKEKIAKGEVKTTTRRSNYALRFVGVAASVAAMLFAVVMIQSIIGEQPVYDGMVGIQAEDMIFFYAPDDYDGNQPGDTVFFDNSNQQPQQAMETPAQAEVSDEYPAHTLLPFDMHPLILNEVESTGRAFAWFRHVHNIGLRVEQMQAVFPFLQSIRSTRDYYSNTLSAFAYYNEDHLLKLVDVFEQVHDFDLWLFNMRLQVGERETMEMTALSYGVDAVPSDVHGVPVTAFVQLNWDTAFLRAEFSLDGMYYHVTLMGYDLDKGKVRLTEIVNLIVVSGPLDFSSLANPELPFFREEMSIEQAKQDPEFGRFLPTNVPRGFTVLGHASRRIGEGIIGNSLSTFWHNFGIFHSSNEFFAWTVMTPRDWDLERIVSIHDRHLYDVSITPMPRGDFERSECGFYVTETIGHQTRTFRAIVFYPTFLAEEISLDTVRARTEWIYAESRLEETGWHTHNFGVLVDDDVIIRINAQGLTAEDIWAMLESVLN